MRWKYFGLMSVFIFYWSRIISDTKGENMRESGENESRANMRRKSDDNPKCTFYLECLSIFVLHAKAL